jgi:hypothetical protein
MIYPPVGLLPPSLSEPPALAREYWKTLAGQMEKLDRARVKQAEFDLEAIRLREELTRAQQRDQQALGRALAAGEPEPEGEAPRIEREIEPATRNAAAMHPVIAEETERVTNLVLRSRDTWRKDLERRLADKAAAYRTAIVQLERTRDELVAEVEAGGWLSVFPETGGAVPTGYIPEKKAVDPLTGYPEPATAPRRTFRELRDDLLRNSEQLPAAGPVRPSAAYLRSLDRKQLVFARVDSEGNTHPQVFEGNTRAGWLVRDVLRRNDPDFLERGRP